MSPTASSEIKPSQVPTSYKYQEVLSPTNQEFVSPFSVQFNLSAVDQMRLNTSLLLATPRQPSAGDLGSSAVQTPGGQTEDFTSVNINLLLAEDPGVAGELLQISNSSSWGGEPSVGEGGLLLKKKRFLVRNVSKNG